MFTITDLELIFSHLPTLNNSYDVSNALPILDLTVLLYTYYYIKLYINSKQILIFNYFKPILGFKSMETINFNFFVIFKTL